MQGVALFDFPVGTPEERAQAVNDWPGFYVDATGFATYYTATGKPAYHTGHDLNCNAPRFDADAHAPVYAIADGLVVFAGDLPVWAAVVVVKHMLPGGGAVWSRYAHVEQLQVKMGDTVVKGGQLARIGNAKGRYPFHLHVDAAVIDLGAHPGDWPGADRTRLMRDYINMLSFIRAFKGVS